MTIFKFAGFAIALNLCILTDVNAASLNVTCQVGSGGSRSSIKVRGTELKGNYYVRIFSGEEAIRTEDKATSSKSVIEYRFDSDSGYIASHPGTLAIAPDFIKKRGVVGVLRKVGTNARLGAVRTRCSKQ